jgi:hypothetical protein
MSWNSGYHTPSFSLTSRLQVGSFNYYCDLHGTDLGNGSVSGMGGNHSCSPNQQRKRR